MKKILFTLATALIALQTMAAGWPANYKGVMLQGFYWDSYSDTKWSVLTSQADNLSKYFSLIWVPNSANCQSSTAMGYTPVYWFNQSSSFGTESELRTMISTFKEKGTGIIEDVVINHKSGKSNWCDFPTETWNGNRITWTMADICSTDECANNGYKPTGAADTGEDFDGSRDLDHTGSNVQNNVKIYLNYLLNDLGYAGFRYDMVKGYGPAYTKLYNESAQPTYSVGEYWDGSYSTVTNWIKNTNYESAAFDYPLKYVINRAFENANWSALSDKGIAGDANMNRYSVTFIDNHDTYQQTDNGRLYNNVLAANAFILAMPGTPCIFMKHWQAYQTEIGNMILARNAAGITNQSSITSQGTQGSGYVMKVQGSVGSVMLILGYVENADVTGYKLISTGTNYAYYVSNNVDVDGTTTDEEKDINVYVNASAAPYVYAWKSGSETALSAAWPGDKLSKTTTTSDGKSWYYTTYRTTSLGIVINDGGTNQTSDITNISDDIYLVYNGTTGYTNVTSTYTGGGSSTLPECAKYIDGHLFCYFEGNATFSSPNAWIWNESTNFTGGTWPGTALTKVGTAENGNSVYLWDFGATPTELPTGVVFSTGTGSPQTNDFEFTNGGYYNPTGLVDVVKGASALTGDVNEDGKVDTSDVTALINKILGSADWTNADVNGDGKVDTSDVTALISLILGA